MTNMIAPHSHVTLSSKYSNDELAPNNINANYIKVRIEYSL